MGIFSNYLFAIVDDELITVSAKLEFDSNYIDLKLFTQGVCVDSKSVTKFKELTLRRGRLADIEVKLKQGFFGTKFTLLKNKVEYPLTKSNRRNIEALNKQARLNAKNKDRDVSPTSEETKIARPLIKTPFLITEEHKTELKKLGELCLNPNDHFSFIELVDFMKDQDSSSILNYLSQKLQEKEIYFLRALDWKQTAIELEQVLSEYGKLHFSTTVNFSGFDSFPPKTIIAQVEVLEAYRQWMHTFGLELVNLETGSDQYILLMHRLNNKEKIMQHSEKAGLKIIPMQ